MLLLFLKNRSQSTQKTNEKVSSTSVIPTGVYPHNADSSYRLHSQRWLTRCGIVTGQFVTRGSQLSNALGLPTFFTFGPSLFGLGPSSPKYDLLPTNVYHPAKFHRSAPTNAGDIRYKINLDKQTNKQTVNDISPECLSASGNTSMHVIRCNSDFVN